jgi:gliding motility-associated-like protein
MKKVFGFILFLFVFAASSFASDTTCVSNMPVDFKITNVITPNNDGYNDEFKVISQNLNDLNVSIYDRWGALVYSYSGVNGYWDGTSFGSVLSDGVYYYVATYSTSCKSNQIITSGGFVQLISGSGN